MIFVFVCPGADIPQYLLEQLHVQNLIPGSWHHETYDSIFGPLPNFSIVFDFTAAILFEVLFRLVSCTLKKHTRFFEGRSPHFWELSA